MKSLVSLLGLALASFEFTVDKRKLDFFQDGLWRSGRAAA
jgi:hypothetical protein